MIIKKLKTISSNNTVDNNDLLHHQNHQNHARASLTFWCFGSSGDSSKIFFVRVRPVKGLLAVYRNFGSVPRKFLRFLFHF